MEILPTALPDVLLIKPKLFADERGYFFESYNQRAFEEKTGVRAPFVQDNVSHSKKGVLRGLHFQNPQAQGKLVRVLAGEIFDVVVDVRRSAPTFGRWSGQQLSSENALMIWVPPGFAHGFLTLSETADVLYKTTDFYAPAHEHCIVWNDPQLAIAWPLEGAPLLSPKDRAGKPLGDSAVFA